MQDDLSARLSEVQQEYGAAQNRLQTLEAKVSQLRRSLVQLRGALQDLEQAQGVAPSAVSFPGASTSPASESTTQVDTFDDVYVQGTLGVGTSAPAGRADIVATGLGEQELLNLISGGVGGGDLPTLRWKANDGRVELELWTDSSSGYSRLKSAGALALHAGGVGWTGSNEFITVQQTGNVGIGTLTPQARLHVAGDMQVDGALRGTAAQSYYAP